MLHQERNYSLLKNLSIAKTFELFTVFVYFYKHLLFLQKFINLSCHMKACIGCSPWCHLIVAVNKYLSNAFKEAIEISISYFVSVLLTCLYIGQHSCQFAFPVPSSLLVFAHGDCCVFKNEVYRDIQKSKVIFQAVYALRQLQEGRSSIDYRTSTVVCTFSWMCVLSKCINNRFLEKELLKIVELPKLCKQLL